MQCVIASAVEGKRVEVCALWGLMFEEKTAEIPFFQAGCRSTVNTLALNTAGNLCPFISKNVATGVNAVRGGCQSPVSLCFSAPVSERRRRKAQERSRAELNTLRSVF